MHLAELPIKLQSRERQVYTLQGINRSDNYPEGSLLDCKNISARRYPYYTTRYDRSRIMPYENATDMSSWNSLLVIDGTKLYYDGIERGDVSAGQKQFAVINTKIFIMPDKKYLDLNTLTLVDVENKQGIDGSIIAASASDNTQTLTIVGGKDSFTKYDDNTYVRVALTKNDTTLTYDLFYEYATVSGTDMILTFNKAPSVTFPADTYSRLEIKANIPDFDYICSSENRIWGCTSKDQTIYVSEQGYPKFFSLSTESSSAAWQMNVATPQDFTGCASLGSSVLFFKEYCAHKVLGPTSSYTYDMDGVKKGCHKSLLVINDTLYYLSNRGVMMYTGSKPTKISDGLGDIPLNDAVAGTDGERYYLYCNDGRDSLFTLDLKTGEWLREDDRKITAFARINSKLYMIIDGQVWTNTTLPLVDDWYLQFNDIFESSYNNYGRVAGTVFGKKFYSKLILRAEMGSKSYAAIKVRTDNGRWEDVGKIVGRNGVFTHVIPLNRCDKFGIMIEGHGEFTLLAMSREFIVGSVRNE